MSQEIKYLSTSLLSFLFPPPAPGPSSPLSLSPTSSVYPNSPPLLSPPPSTSPTSIPSVSSQPPPGICHRHLLLGDRPDSPSHPVLSRSPDTRPSSCSPGTAPLGHAPAHPSPPVRDWSTPPPRPGWRPQDSRAGSASVPGGGWSPRPSPFPEIRCGSEGAGPCAPSTRRSAPGWDQVAASAGLLGSRLCPLPAPHRTLEAGRGRGPSGGAGEEEGKGSEKRRGQP